MAAAALLAVVLAAYALVGGGASPPAEARTCSETILVWHAGIDMSLPPHERVVHARAETVHYSGMTCWFR